MNITQLKQLIWRPGRTLAYTQRDLTKVHNVVGSVVVKAMKGIPISWWDRLRLWSFGFEHNEVVYDNVTFIIINEKASNHGGAGTFMIRKAGISKRILQAPHSFFDEKTGDLALLVFLLNSSFKALFVNTLHRYIHEDGNKVELEPSSANHADACHWPQHPIAEVSRMCFEELLSSVVQIHGFEKIQGYPDAIVSAGSTTMTYQATDVWLSMKSHFPGHEIKNFPGEVNYLGATTNVQGQDFMKLGGSFVHVELADSFREELVASLDLRIDLAQALSAV